MASNFEILRSLGEDTSSTLHLVRDKKRGRESCMRRFKTRKMEEVEGLKELFMQVSHIDSPNLQPIVEFGTDREGFFYVTETPPPGESLSEMLERGPLTEKEFEVVALQLLDVLDVLHEQTIVHGSLRPDFVRIAGTSPENWRVTLHGFGQGFAGRDDSKEEQIRAYRCTAPEQWQDGTTRRRTDVYALGCVLYEALAARPPFDGKALKELRLKHLGHDLAPLQKLASHVPAWLCSWVMHLLAVDPEQRPRKAAVARELFQRREAPNQAVPPAPAEAPTAAVPATPPVNISLQPSAPVVLPMAQQGTRHHATSSTIPIAAGPHVGAAAKAKRPATAAVQPLRKAVAAPLRKPTQPTQPSQPTQPAAPRNLKPIIGAVGTVLSLVLVFALMRCGHPPSYKDKTEQKRR